MDMNELSCAIRGPITLITIGSLFAMDHFTQYGFDRTWPILLIVFGVLSLICRTGNTRTPGGAR